MIRVKTVWWMVCWMMMGFSHLTLAAYGDFAHFLEPGQVSVGVTQNNLTRWGFLRFDTLSIESLDVTADLGLTNWVGVGGALLNGNQMTGYDVHVQFKLNELSDRTLGLFVGQRNYVWNASNGTLGGAINGQYSVTLTDIGLCGNTAVTDAFRLHFSGLYSMGNLGSQTTGGKVLSKSDALIFGAGGEFDLNKNVMLGAEYYLLGLNGSSVYARYLF